MSVLVIYMCFVIPFFALFLGCFYLLFFLVYILNSVYTIYVIVHAGSRRACIQNAWSISLLHAVASHMYMQEVGEPVFRMH